MGEGQKKTRERPGGPAFPFPSFQHGCARESAARGAGSGGMRTPKCMSRNDVNLHQILRADHNFTSKRFSSRGGVIEEVAILEERE